jgi:Putative adhesin
MARILTATSLLTAVIMLAGCSPMAGLDNATEDFHFSYELQPGGQLDLTNTNGSVEITGWDRNALDVSGTKYGPDPDRLKDVKVNVSASGKNATIATYIPKGDWHGSYGVRYRIRVPRNIALRDITTTNGSVTAEDLSGGGHIKSTNGKLSLTYLVGDYRAETTNGAIEIENCSGVQRADTTNGSVRGRLKEGAIEATSTNGPLDVTVEKPRENTPMRMKTTNGSLALALAEFHSNAIRATTTHGSVTLRLPDNTNARLRAETSMASIHNDLPLSSTEEISKHELRGQLGSGGPEIEASTSMGGIRISRY